MMKINITDNQVLELVLISDSKVKQAAKDFFKFAEESSISNGKARFKTKVEFGDSEFYVVFTLVLQTDEDALIRLTYRSTFQTDSPLDEGFKQSSFAFVNAPAIAYPYLRAFVSNLTLSTGYSPVMLPSVNFVAMKERVIADSAEVETTTVKSSD